MDIIEQQKIINDLVNEGEKDKAVRLLIDWSKQTSFSQVTIDILEPLLVDVGQRWMQGKVSLAFGYLSGKIAEEFYTISAESLEYKPKDIKGTVILGNIEDDFHPLGRRMVNIYSKAAGWNIIDLGNDVPAELFIEEAIKNNADIIAISAMMFTTAKNISKVRVLLDSNNLSNKLKLAVGGAVFKLRPELVAVVGGDGTAETAIGAPELFSKLRIKN